MICLTEQVPWFFTVLLYFVPEMLPKGLCVAGIVPRLWWCLDVVSRLLGQCS